VKGRYGSVKTATLVIPSFLQEWITRQAISPRFAINTFVILGRPVVSVGSGGKFNAFPVFNVVILNSLLAQKSLRTVFVSARERYFGFEDVPPAL
jgi:hypothetical protein